MGRISFSAGTDNQGNSGLVRKWLTTKWPLCAVSMELSARLTHLNLDLDLIWRRRDVNVEADDLTNFKFEKFDMKNRVDSKQVLASLSVMRELLALGEQFALAKKEAVGRQVAGRDSRRVGLRLADPW